MQDKHVPTRLTPSDFKILLGVYDLKGQFEVGLKVAIVQKVHVHPDWNPKAQSFDADIAVLELGKEIQYAEFIQPICLIPPQSQIASITQGIVVGFGRSEDNPYEKIAKVIEMPIHSYAKCAESEDHHHLISHRTICAGYANGTGVCSGDSGSGLIVLHNGAYYLRGIVSSSLFKGLNCNVDAYSVLTDVTKYYGWIKTGKAEEQALNINQLFEAAKTSNPELYNALKAFEESLKKKEN